MNEGARVFKKTKGLPCVGHSARSRAHAHGRPPFSYTSKGSPALPFKEASVSSPLRSTSAQPSGAVSARNEWQPVLLALGGTIAFFAAFVAVLASH